MIKSCLKQRPDLKVIITSATIDTSVFRDYFNLKDESVLQISGRTYPIEDVWLEHDVELGWDYFNKTIETAYSILNEEQGDILAFLTTPIETEKAVEAFNDILKKTNYQRKIAVFHLHGKLDIQEQQKIFERTQAGTRKVVFSTNCAETSVTIPGICYVIDCGMVKESQYDVKRNMNVLSVGFVSRSSAEQRRGRAGRTQVGKCYRLYSTGNYEKNMSESTEPEILRVNLGQALLKLMEMGINDPVQFDFVKSPPQESLNHAMKQLMHLEAVNVIDLSLTQLGRNMSHLPIEPRLSYLVFKGIESNVGFEAVILAALVTVSRAIFFRNMDNKVEADKIKMRFCQSESDFLTYFEVYKEWIEVPKETRSKWCVMNCINARSMRVAHDLVNELISTLSKEINLHISSKLTINNAISETLLEIIFKSFSQNLCIFSGHYRLGYKSCDVPGELLIHPSSSLYTFGQWRPEYLVYDTLLKTNQTYLINISHVPESMVTEAFECGRLQVDLECLKNLQLIPLCIAPVGETIIIRDIIGKKGAKLMSLQNQLKSLIGQESLIIDTNVKKGEVKIFIPEVNHEVVTQVFSSLICDSMQKFLDEQREVPNIAGRFGLTGIVAAGAEIKDIILPGEFRDVKVTLLGDCEISAAVAKLEECGNIVCPPRVFKNYSKVTFSSPVSAKMAVKAFDDEKSFSLQGMVKHPLLEDRPPFYKVVVTALRRPCKGEAYLTIDPISSFQEVSMNLRAQSIVYRNVQLNIGVSKKSQDFRISNLPPDTDKRQLEELFQSYISSEIKITKLIIVRPKPFDSTKEDVETFKSRLGQMFSEFTPLEKILIEVKNPNSKDFTWNAIVFFSNSLDGEIAISALKGRNINATQTGFHLYELKPVLQTYIYCKRVIFNAVQNQIEAALQFFNNGLSTDKLDITAVPKGDENVQITITSNNISDIIDAKKSILNSLQGDQIKCSGNTLEKMFSSAGIAFLRKLQECCINAHINFNVHSKVISLFGMDSVCSLAKTKINSFLEQLEQENYEEINLFDSCQRRILKKLLKDYGYNLEKLKDFCDLTAIEVNSYTHLLTIRGSSASVSKCQMVIKKISEELNTEPMNEMEEEECPICLVTVDEQYHRLEYCAHSYCKECLLNLLQNSDGFPINCLMCNSPIVLADIFWAAKEIKSLETDLYTKALDDFAGSSSNVKFCPSPDCTMLYRVTVDEENVFDCPSCNNSICTKCGVIYHFGMSCEIYKCYKNDDDYSLKMWLKERPDNRKMCPSCSAPIEKNGGCNHMTCWKCKCHMCWLCLQTFPTGGDVYNHQGVCLRQL